MKLVSGISLIVSVALFAQVWAGPSEPAAESAAAESAPTSSGSVNSSGAADGSSAASSSRKVSDRTDAAAKALAQKASRPRIRWLTDLNIARELSVELNRPMLIVFDADWCSYCRKMERTTLSETELIHRINREFVPVHLNLDDHGRTAEILEVKRIPCTVALSPRADLLGRLTGYVGRDQYGTSLTRVLELHRKIDKQLAAATK